MNEIITSALGKLDWRDALHGLYMAVGGAVFPPIIETLQSSLSAASFDFHFDWTASWHTAVAAAAVYLFKKLWTPAQVITPLK